MRGIDIFCVSQASTAICLSMDQIQPSSSSSSLSSTSQLGGRAIDRHNPIIRDGRRFTRSLPTPPCTSQPPPINPKPYHQLQKSKKGSADNKKKKKDQSKKIDVTKKISSSEICDPDETARKSWAKKGAFITPPGSSRYLLSDKIFLDGLADYDPAVALAPTDTKQTQALNQDKLIASTPSSSSCLEKPPRSDQVVVLRVSLHCRGCEGKVRKHLSRMQGVTSFNIDFAAKKVTVTGDVTPLGVLASISKVKNAQFWPLPSPTPSPAPAASSNPAIKK